MTCGPVATTFRVLSADARWDLDLAAGDGAVLGDAIELARLDPTIVDADALSRVMPPPWVAHGCDACVWYVLSPPGEPPAVLLRFAPCDATIAAIACHVALVEPVAVATTRGLVAVLDAGRRELLVVSPGGERVITAIPAAGRGPIAFSGRSIVVADGRELAAYDLVGSARRDLAPAPGPIARLAVAGGAIWAAIATAGGLALMRLGPGGWAPAQLADLAAVARDTGIASVSDSSSSPGTDVVCVRIPRDDIAPCIVCIDRKGVDPLPAGEAGRAPPPRLASLVDHDVRLRAGRERAGRPPAPRHLSAAQQEPIGRRDELVDVDGFEGVGVVHVRTQCTVRALDRCLLFRELVRIAGAAVAARG